MIPRYSRPEMAAIFAPETRLGIWLDVELAAAEAMAEIGAIPAEPIRDLAATVAAQPRAADRPGPGRGDRGHDPARRDRLPDPCRAGLRRGGAVPASRPDLVRPARHDAGDPARARVGPDPGRPRRAAGRAGAARLRAQAHAHDRPQPRHPCRADHASASSSPATSPSSPATGARMVQARYEIMTCAMSGAVGTFANVDPRVEAAVAAAVRPAARAGLDPGDPARPARRVHGRAGPDRLERSSAWRPRSATCSAPRSARPRSRSRSGRRAARPCRTSATRCCRRT